MAQHKPGKQPTSSVKPPPARNKAVGAAVSVKRKRVDWEAVERDYRTGKYSLRELESMHGISYAGISRKAKALGWTKDLREAIKQATDAALLHEAVTKAQKDVTQTVVVTAEINKQVILGHREGLGRLTAINEKLLSQIEQAAEQLPELVAVIEMVRQPDENGIDRANDMMRKAMSRSALVDDLKKLTEVNERVRKGEREAFGLDERADDDGGDKSFLEAMLNARARAANR